MQPKISPDAKFPSVIDSSIRASFVACPTKFYWSYVRHLGGTRPSTDLIAGAAFAKGLEVTRKLVYGPDKIALGDALHQGMLAAIAEYGDHDPGDKENKSVEQVVKALDYYFEVFPPATDHIQPMMTADGHPKVEFSFGIPLPINHPVTDEPLIYAGRFDMVGVYRDQLIGVDEKTTSQLGPTWPNQWNMRGQFTGYCWALREYGLPVVGMMVRGISFLKRGFGHAESIQMRADWQIDQWYKQLLADIHRMREAYLNTWYDQDFSESCSAYGGCGFQRLCNSPEPENWINGYYVRREWNPLKKNPAEQPTQSSETIQAPDELLALLPK